MFRKVKVLVSSLVIAIWIFYILGSRTDSPDVANNTHLDALEKVEYGVDHRLGDVFNRTLGFEHVYMISLPTRSDKLDTFTMQAHLSNISFTHVEGVDGRTVPANALPYGFDQSPGAIGCWRAHLNIFQQMVQHNIQSAIIFEDDADWEVALKHQLTQFARGARWLTNQSEEVIPLSPYGDNWDILWVGHCSAMPEKPTNRRWVIPHDPTVLPPEWRWEWDQPDMSYWDTPDSDNQTRLAYVPEWCSCTAAYAISLSGAKKVLYRQSLNPFNEPVDNGMGNMCRFKTYDFRCVTVFPTIIGTSTPAGDKNRGSDINTSGDEEEKHYEEQSRSWRLMFPVRQNIERLMRGQTTFKSEHPDITGEEMGLSEIGRAVGHPEIPEFREVAVVEAIEEKDEGEEKATETDGEEKENEEEDEEKDEEDKEIEEIEKPDSSEVTEDAEQKVAGKSRVQLEAEELEAATETSTEHQMSEHMDDATSKSDEDSKQGEVQQEAEELEEATETSTEHQMSEHNERTWALSKDISEQDDAPEEDMRREDAPEEDIK